MKKIFYSFKFIFKTTLAIFLFSQYSYSNEKVLLCMPDCTKDFLTCKKEIISKSEKNNFKTSELQFRRSLQAFTITPDNKLNIERAGDAPTDYKKLYFETEKYLIFRDLIGLQSSYTDQLIVIDRINLRFSLQNFPQIEPIFKNWSIKELIEYADKTILATYTNKQIENGYGGVCILDELKKKKI